MKKKNYFYLYFSKKSYIYRKDTFMKTLILILILIALYPYFVDGFKLLIWHLASLLSFIVKSINNAGKRLSK